MGQVHGAYLERVDLRGLVERVGDAKVVLLGESTIPELPIKHDDSHQSFKADYMVTSQDRATVFLVELKTDTRSRRLVQDAYLEGARMDGFAHISEGLRHILLASDQQQKYFHLVKSFERLGFWTVPADLSEYLFPERRRGLRQRLRAIAATELRPELKVLYVQPKSDGDPRCIDFACFARHVELHPDPLSQRFAESLRRWQEPAGRI